MAPTHNLHSALTDMHTSVHLQRNGDLVMEQNPNISVNRSNTLQSVLRGEIPSAYVHLTTPLRNNVPHDRHYSKLMDVSGAHIHSHKNHEHSFRPYTCNSPLRNALNSSPAPSGSPKRNVSPFVERQSTYHNGAYIPDHNQVGLTYGQASPAFESRSSPYRDSGSPFIGSSPYYNGSPHYQGSSSRSMSPSVDTGSPYPAHQHDGSMYSPHRAASPYSPGAPNGSPYTSYENSDSPFSGSQYFDGSNGSHINSDGYSQIESDQPIDLSCKSDSMKHTSSAEDLHDGSLLRNLLMPGKAGTSESLAEHGRESPGSDVYKPDVSVTGTTRVTLAKKMVYPITSRVSDWLVKIVQFSKSIPEFQSMSQNDKITLLLNSWTRMLILLMAEHDYEFAVTPVYSQVTQSTETPTQDEPTMKSVEGIQGFIRKCKNMYMDQKEYALLRMAVLFNSGNVGLDDPEIVEKLNSAVQQLLQQHVTSLRPDEAMRYSRILMLMPSLYGINCRMVENLFCKRINTDMQVLLKEMLQKL